MQHTGKIRITTIRARKSNPGAVPQPILCVTAYDAITAAWADAAGMDLILVGDSLGNTVLGHETTICVTLDDMIHHAAAVARGSKRALRVGDLPFMTYKITAEQALTSAARLMQEGRVEAIKLEGGRELAPTIERLVRAGIPVLGHIGLLPQSIHAQGGYRVQGRDEESAQRLMLDALELQQAGCFAIVLEGIPAPVAQQLTQKLEIPTIGIGAGRHCDGQILVLADVLGMTDRSLPRFAKSYANLRTAAVDALRAYGDEVRAGGFPGEEQSYER